MSFKVSLAQCIQLSKKISTIIYFFVIEVIYFVYIGSSVAGNSSPILRKSFLCSIISPVNFEARTSRFRLKIYFNSLLAWNHSFSFNLHCVGNYLWLILFRRCFSAVSIIAKINLGLATCTSNSQKLDLIKDNYLNDEDRLKTKVSRNMFYVYFKYWCSRFRIYRWNDRTKNETT